MGCVQVKSAVVRPVWLHSKRGVTKSMQALRGPRGAWEDLIRRSIKSFSFFLPPTLNSD